MSHQDEASVGTQKEHFNFAKGKGRAKGKRKKKLWIFLGSKGGVGRKQKMETVMSNWFHYL